MQILAVVFACVALFAGAHACSDDTTRLDRCNTEFERQANALLPSIAAGRASQMALCPLTIDLEQCMLNFVNNMCDASTKGFLRTMVTQLMHDARTEVGCNFMARRDTQKLIARSAALSQQAALAKV